MDQLKKKQQQEADALLKEGKSLLKKTLFRWTPEYDTAATKFDKAANLYKLLGNKTAAYQAYKEGANAHNSAGQIYFAAKDCEMAAKILQEDNKIFESSQDYKKAALLFLEDGKSDRAAETYARAAKMLENDTQYVNQVVELYNEAVSALEIEDNKHVQVNTMSSLMNFFARNGKLDEAVETLSKMANLYSSLKQPHNIYKCGLSGVVLLLEKDDFAAADDFNNKFRETYPDYGFQKECNTAQELLDCFENNDIDMLESVKAKHSTLKYLQQSVIQIARKLKIKPLGENRPPRKSKSSKLDKNKEALFAGAGEEEEEEEGDDNSTNKVEKENVTSVTTTTTTTTNPVSNQGKEDERQEEEEEEENDMFDPNNLT